MPTTILDNETYPEALQRRYSEETKAEKQAEIIRMATEVWGYSEWKGAPLERLERFFNLAFAAGAAYEREACAKVCERLISGDGICADDGVWIHDCAAAIRARGEK